jgi:hypothetical protein
MVFLRGLMFGQVKRLSVRLGAARDEHNTAPRCHFGLGDLGFILTPLPGVPQPIAQSFLDRIYKIHKIEKNASDDKSENLVNLVNPVENLLLIA